jgi:arylformamidase
MRIFDITVSLQEGMTVYQGDPEFKFEKRLRISKGDPCNLGVITMGLHNGTHFDAPYHIVDKGMTFDRIPVERFFGRALVVEVKDKVSIKPGDVADLDLKGAGTVLFKTRNSVLLEKNKPFAKDFVHLTPEAAEILGKRYKVGCVGIDYLSVDRFHSGTHPAHHALLKHGVLILETVNLFRVPAGLYEFFAGALRIRSADAGPARVFLRGPVG